MLCAQFRIHSSMKYIGTSLNTYGCGSEQWVAIRCSGANIRNMTLRVIKYTFTGITKLSKALKPMALTSTALYKKKEYLVLSTSNWVTAKPTFKKTKAVTCFQYTHTYLTQAKRHTYIATIHSYMLLAT